MTEWISVKDRLPELHRDVLIMVDRISIGYRMVFDPWNGRDGGAGWSGYGADSDTSSVTHWMPLPSPPVVVNEESK